MSSDTKKLEAVYGLSKAIVGALDTQDVLKRVVETTSRILDVEKVSIMKLSREEGVLRIVASKGVKGDVASSARVRVGEGISGKVFESSKPVLIEDIKESRFSERKGYKSRSLMSAPVRCLPLKVGGKPIGVINVTDRRKKRSFTKEDLDLLTAVANQTAAYLYLCDLAEEAKKSAHIARELELARTIQQRLLPKREPKISGMDISGACVTAQKVGGDYFDYLFGGGRPVSLIVADISGHSIGAAMTMSAFRSALRAGNYASLFSPSIAVERINSTLFEDLCAAEQFISMAYVQIMSSRSGERFLKYTTAGHYPPLLF